jgi:hypothetical protein
MSALQMECVPSGVSDVSGLPLDAEAGIDDAEYARIMRRITVGGGTDTGACAFNSSI